MTFSLFEGLHRLEREKGCDRSPSGRYPALAALAAAASAAWAEDALAAAFSLASEESLLRTPSEDTF
jgi:hypothetical protein